MRARLQVVIDQLAARYQGPRFIPHLTVAVSSEIRPAAVAQTLQQGSARSAPQVLTPLGLRFSPAFTQSCYLPLPLKPELIALVHCVQARTSPSAARPFDPHMSLFYGTLRQAQRQSIANSLALPGAIHFSELWAIQLNNTTRCAQDVHAWQVIGTAKLSAAATRPPSQNAQTPRDRSLGPAQRYDTSRDSAH